MIQSENGNNEVTLMDVLNSINLETFNGCSGSIDGIQYDIAKVADNVWLVVPSAGTWQQQVHDNIKRMEALMLRSNADEADLNMSVPYAGVGYTLTIKISKVKPASALLAPTEPVSDSQHTSNRGRRSRGI